MASYRFKIILAGDEAVGKTSTILRFVHNTYSELYKPTLGFQISVKNLNYRTPTNEDRIVIFSIWDIAGQGQFSGVRKGYYQATDGVLLLFDLTRRKTFEDAKFWADEIRSVAPNAPIVLVGNKADLPSQAVLPQELTYISKENHFAAFAISSAATGRGVEEIFKMVADAIIDAISAPKAPVSEPGITVNVAPVITPTVTKQQVQAPMTSYQAPAAPVENAPPVQRQPPILPRIEITLPVRSVPQAPPIEVQPVVTPTAPIIPQDAVKPVVVPPLHIMPETLEPPVEPSAPMKVSPQIEPVQSSDNVEVPVNVKPPGTPPLPTVVPVITESPDNSLAPVVVPDEKIAPHVPAPSPIVPKALEGESQPQEPKKSGLWQKLFRRKK